MGFDLTGLNPKNLHIKEPKEPDNLWELPKEKPTFDNIGNTTIIPTSVIQSIKKIKV